MRAAGAATVMVMAGVLAGPGTAQAASCLAWSGRHAPNPPGGQDLGLFGVGVAVVSACDVWMVGRSSPPAGSGNDVDQTLIEHWTGGQVWKAVPSPSPDQNPGAQNQLTAVAAASATDIWAVGYYTDDTDPVDHGLILHWDGSSWTQAAAPPDSGKLNAVTVLSASNAWAVGTDSAGQPLILHYDGTGWTRSPSPIVDLSNGSAALGGVTATSASDVWAVGAYPASSGIAPLIFHWEGSQWSQLPSPPGTPAGTQLFTVSAASPGDVWAAGEAVPGGNSANVILHWDGQSWSVVPSPDPGTGAQGNTIAAVTAVSANSAWAVGFYFNSAQGVFHNLLLHWDGHSWTQAPAPDTASFVNTFSAVAAGPAGTLWIAGWAANSNLTELGGTVFGFMVIPSVVGDTLHVAESAMLNAGLLPSTTSVSPPAPGCSASNEGTVIATSPPPGAFTTPPVTMTVCRPPAS